MSAEKKTRCGFVGLIGAPNAGKSTLLNTVVGSKVSIVSPKVQTTRSRVVGIVIHDGAQIVFVDTPGIFSPKRRLEKAMVAAAWQGARDADVTVLLVDAAKKRIDDDTRAIIDQLRQNDAQVMLALNKIDLIEKEKLLALAAEMNETGVFSDIYMISALNGNGLDKFMEDVTAKMPEGPWLYDEDQISDMPMRLLAAEITREKVFLQLHDELPYACAVETESWEEREDGSVRIAQVVYVMRDSQKAIVLGRKGRRIKALGIAAREELEDILGRRVHLSLFVKVREKWVDDPERYSEWGLDFNA